MAQVTLNFLITIIIYHGSILVECTGFNRIIEGRSFYWGEGCMGNNTAYDIISDTLISTREYNDTMNCKDDEWIIDWDADDLGKGTNRKSCLPVPPSQQANDCSSCLCARDPIEPDCTDIPGYNFNLVEYPISWNEVIVGLDLRESYSSFEIFIRRAILLSNGMIDHNRSFLLGPIFNSLSLTNCKEFSNNVRTIFLDDVILPAKYVVTGVRMVAINERTAGRKGWKLQVKGTEYDSSFKLVRGTDQWFDYTNDSNRDTSYDRNRTEIILLNRDDHMYVADNITDTNHYVRIRASSLYKPFVHVAIPKAEYKLVTSIDKSPLQGIGLSYRRYPGSAGGLTVKVIPHKSLIFTPSPVETAIGTTIETTTVRPKIKTINKLLTPPTTPPTTTTAAATITVVTSPVAFNGSTQSPPIVHTKLQQLPTQPVNVSCNSQCKIESSQEETVDIRANLSMPVDKSVNAGVMFFSQFSLISFVLLFILLS